MKIIVSQILPVMELLKAIANSDNLHELDTNKVWDLVDFVAAVDKAMNPFEQIRVMKIKAFGVKKENGDFVIPPEKMDEFNEAISDALNREVELPNFSLTLEELKKINKMPSINQLRSAEWLFKRG